MNRRIFRIVKSRYAASAFDGEGAKVYGGRWNYEGYPMVYTSESLALAALEMFVQLDNIPHTHLISISATIPTDLTIETLDNLPEGWNLYPASSLTQEYGTKWLQSNRSAIFKVPSAIIATEFNYLLNPLHPDFKKIKIEDPLPFAFDKRFWKKSDNET